MSHEPSTPAKPDRKSRRALPGGVQTPRLVRRWASLAILLFLASPFILALVPWQQTVQGRGDVTAYAPVDRMQVIEAMVAGQIRRWHVVEGTRVKFNDPIVDIEDNDPDLSARLEAQRGFLKERLEAAQKELEEQRAATEAQVAARDAAMLAASANRDAARKSIEVARQVRANANFAEEYERNRSEMFDDLFTNPQYGGLESRISRDEARMRSDRAATDTDKAEAEIERAEAFLLTQESLVVQADAAGLSAIAVARGNLRKSEQNLFSVQRELQELETRIERFKDRIVLAPCDGTVYRVAANVSRGGQYVKEGDELCTIVPDSSDRVVELLLDGNDAPLVLAYAEQTGSMPHVRIQFEGWPAVQFSGWPELAVGTFGGKIRQIDPASNSTGKFRILVEPDPMLAGDTWPDQSMLRQGNQAIGWVFLNRVPLGYEIWRRLNGFPPVLAPPGKDGGDKDKDGGKPPKVKVG